MSGTEEQEKQSQESEKQAPTQPANGEENQGPTQTDENPEDQEDG
jgi:hypothetical protein